MDNFEWDDGFSLRFGLTYVDYDADCGHPQYQARGHGNCTRYPKKSARWFQNRTEEFGTAFPLAPSPWQAAVQACVADVEQPPPRMPTGAPNLVFILSDDWGWADASWHREPGYAEISTPKMEVFSTWA